MSIGAVLPLALRGSYDVDDLRRSQLLFRSLRTYSPAGLIDRFLVVMPDHQIERARPALAEWEDLGVELLSEERLLPSFRRFGHVRGWRKQQLIKIAAAREMRSDYFVTLDADIVATKALEIDEFVTDGRARTQYCFLDEHPNWWSSSARILGLPQSFVTNLEVGLHATPAVLSREICIQLMDRLVVGRSTPGKDKKSWDEQLLELHGWHQSPLRAATQYRMRKWTEYSLYYLFALREDLWTRHHTPSIREDGALTTPVYRYFPNEDFSAALLDQHFGDPDRPPFALLGTKAMISLDLLERELGRHFGDLA